MSSGLSQEELEDLQQRGDEPCKLCGGVHITIDELDGLSLDELWVVRCNQDFTIARKVLEIIQSCCYCKRLSVQVGWHCPHCGAC